MNKILKSKKIAFSLLLIVIMFSQTIVVMGDLQYKLKISEDRICKFRFRWKSE